MKKTHLLIAGSLFFLSALSQAAVTINGESVAPGSHTVDSSGKITQTGTTDGQGNAAGVIVGDGANSTLCANPFFKKVLPQCR
ncbi:MULTISPECIES: hypothetical protein [Serratia]|uniref:hypothetical protein n=1 Tax=Serratia TaxID=613 RepID=UPI0018A7828F|nr:hypothetical protein [Serratia marcescens]MBF8219175.1 hypothetical protein [Serratia ureilytica]MBF8244676.1 hypothetical protein [Serratia ureilytica]MBH1916848.1 hypothetical protein [Serratia marcescens]MBH2678191.1 hypothetical protein [Serratia marcescens]MBN3974989.1 hypothetical protein [Serratia marcescens]